MNVKLQRSAVYKGCPTRTALTGYW